MADQEIGAISIGISADTRQLKASLAEAQRLAREFKIPEREIPIRVRISTPTDAAIKAAQNKIATALTKAQTLKIDIAPTLTVKGDKIDEFRANIQRAMESKPIELQVKLGEIDENALRGQIQTAIGVIDVPLTWHWQDGPPPPGATGGGAGGSPPRPSTPPTQPAAPAAGESGGVGPPSPTLTVAASAPKIGKAKTSAKGAAKTAAARTTAAKAEPAKSEPVEATAAQVVAQTFAPPKAPNIGQAVITKTEAPPATDKDRRQARFSRAVEQLMRGQPGGIAELLKAGAIFSTDSGGYAVTGAKKGSDFETYMGDFENADDMLDALGIALETFSNIARGEERVPGSRPAFEGKAKALAGHVPLTVGPEGRLFLPGEQGKGLNQMLREQIDKELGEREAEWANRPEVKELKKAMREGGIDALGPLMEGMLPLGEVERLITQSPVQAREALVRQVGTFFAANKKLAAKVFPSTKRSAKSMEGVPAGVEAWAAAASSLFGEIQKVILPFREQVESEERSQAARIRREAPRLSAAEAAPPVDVGPVLSEAEKQELLRDIDRRVAAGELIGGATAKAPKRSLKDEEAGGRPRSAFFRFLEEREQAQAAQAFRSRRRAPAVAATPQPGPVAGPYTGADLPSQEELYLTDEMRAERDAAELFKAQRQKFVDAIAAVQRGDEGVLDPDTGKPLTALSKDHALRSLRSRMGNLKPREGGGPIERARMRAMQQGRIPKDNVYLLAEKRPEEVQYADGTSEIIEEPTIRTFDKPGKVVPNVPEWRRRALEGKGFGKDLTRREAGGSVQSSGFLAQKGRFIDQPTAKAEAAFAKTGLSVQGAGVQRVYVVNWPAAGAGPAFSRPTQGAAAGPFAGPADFINQMGNMFRQQAPKAKAAGGGGGGAGAGGGGTRVARGGLSPLEEAQLEAATQELVTAQRLRLRKLAADISAAIREAPTRGVQTALGEVSAINLGGLRNVIGRRRVAEESQVRATAALNSYAKAQEKLDKLIVQSSKTTDVNKQKAYTAAIEDQGKAVDFLRDRYEKLAVQSEELAKGVITTGDKLKVFGTNVAGIIGGTFIFGGALTAAQVGLTAIGQVLTPVVERLSGYQNITAQITNQLSDQTNAADGAVKSTVALAAANAHLSEAATATIAPALEQRASVEAGNKAFQQAIDLFNASAAIQKQNANRPGEQGLTRTTSGFFGSILNGVPSTSELAGNFLRDVEQQGASGPSLQELQAKRAEVAKQFNPDIDSEFIPALRDIDDQIAKLGESTEGSTAKLTFLNEAMRKGGETFQFRSQQELKVTEDQRRAAANAADLAGAGDLANNIRDRRAILTDQQGNIVTDQRQVTEALTGLNKGLQTPDPAVLISQLKDRIIPAQLAAIEEEGRFQQQQLIPAQSALDFFGQPPLPFGAGFTQVAQGPTGATPFGPAPNLEGLGESAPGVDPAATQSFKTYEQVATTAIDAVRAKAEQGRAALIKLGVPPELIAQYEALGQQAAGIELGVANRTAAFEAAQYNRQLFVMNRNLADARALLGEQVGAQGRLGALQRENFEISKQQHALQIQAQTLALNLQQRQINFQRAIAGFTAPGLTGEERAARIQQAKLEADYAQRQLDIQRKLLGLGKRQFNVDVRIFDESARRQVQDLQFALAELKQARALQLDTRAAQQAIAAVRAQQAEVTKQIGVSIEKATKRSALAINSALDISIKTGEAFAKILGQTAVAWGTFSTQGVNAVTSIITTIRKVFGGSGSAFTNNGPIPAKAHAPGFFGTVSSPTQMTVGEAGTETVAVLRNVREHTLQGPASSGGGGTILIDVHDNTLKSSEDEAKFMAMIIDAVERAQARKAGLLGLRP